MCIGVSRGPGVRVDTIIRATIDIIDDEINLNAVIKHHVLLSMLLNVNISNCKV